MLNEVTKEMCIRIQNESKRIQYSKCTERFDDVFKTLIIVMTLLFSFSISFYKEEMELKFFIYTISFFIFALGIWAIATLYDGKHEYFMKVFAWWFLIGMYGTTIARIYFTLFLLPPLIVSIIVLVNFALTLPIVEYLKEPIGQENYKVLRKGLLVITLVFVTLDVLYFFGLIKFPLG